MSPGRGLRGVLWTFLLLAVVVPALLTAGRSFTGPEGPTLAAWRGFLPPDGPDLIALVVTLALSVASVLLAALIGVPLAFALHRRGSRTERLLLGASLLPLALPPLVGSVAVYLAFGGTGIVPRGVSSLLGLPDASLSLGPIPTVLTVHALTMYPIFLLFAVSALARRDPAQVEAARGLGAGPVRAFLAVTLPGLRPALRGAALLVFLSSMASFSAPYLFAADRPILSVRIFVAQQSGDTARSLALTTALTVASLLAVLLFRPRAGETATDAGDRPPGRARRRTLLLAAPVVLLALLPVGAVLLTAFSANGSWTTTWLPTDYTLDNFRRVLTGAGETGRAVGASLWMAAVATAALLVLGPAAGSALRRGSRLAEALVMLPFALPGTVVAVNLIAASGPLGLRNTIWLLPLAWAIRGLPLLARASAAGLARVPPDLTEAARGLGAGPGRAFFRVTLPLAGPAILAGAVLVFAFALGEFVAATLLYRPENLPLSIAIAQEFRLGNLGSAAALGTLLVALVATVLAVSGRIGAVSGPGRAGPRRLRDGSGAPGSPGATGARPGGIPPSV